MDAFYDELSLTSGPTLSALVNGRVFESETSLGVRYRPVHVLGEGGMGLAFYAVREGPEGMTPAVVKVMKPEVLGSGPTALLMVQKEAVALGRLNERVPPTPFVVRFLDTGTISLQNPPLSVPWLALEYVHGGIEGTTLEQRVEYSVKHTRYGFDPDRGAQTIERLAEGLTAIHDVGVVHRDLTPGNVLCCGFGSSEVPKISDFGMARPLGLSATFGSVLLGTPGYGAPEQSFSTGTDVGPWTDVFSFACLVYFVLTGEQYFDARNFAHALVLTRDAKRRSVLEAPALSPELRDNPTACRGIDVALAQATAMNPSERPRDARSFASSVVPAVRSAGSARSQRASERLVASLAQRHAHQASSPWTWTVRHPPGQDRLLRSVAWDGAGHCLAVTTEGLYFWNGTSWLPAPAPERMRPEHLRATSLVRPGQWLLSSKNGLALVSSDRDAILCPGPSGSELDLASGDPDDLAVVVAYGHRETPVLYSVAARRFFGPKALPSVRAITALARLDDSRWLVTGRTLHGEAFAAVYSAVDFELQTLPAPQSDAFTTASAHVDRGIGVVAGRGGVTLRIDGPTATPSAVPGALDLACSGIDVQGLAWVGAAGHLWSQAGTEPWLPTWEDPSWRSPFVSLRADVGVVTAVTVDGGVLEGRMA